MSAEFIAAARGRGLAIANAIADGKIHRVPVEGREKSEKPGWYALHAPSGGRMFGTYGRWDDGRAAETWHAGEGGKPLTKAERAAIAEFHRSAAYQREQEQRNAAAKALKQWGNFAGHGDSPYLRRKAVTALGVRFNGAAVCVPLRDVENVLWSFQSIGADGEKRFFPGGRTSACFHLIGSVQDHKPLLIVEGYATGATLHMATGAAVACAMNCHNIGPVGVALRGRHPNARIIICADDDAKTEREQGRNPGLLAARAAAKRLNCELVKPEGLRDGDTDFNDLAAARGIDAVKALLAMVLAAPQRHQEVRQADGKRYPDDSPQLEAWPDPLLPSAATTPEIPADLLPGWLGEMAGAVAASTQTPPAMAVMMIVAILGTVLQRRFEVSPWNDEYREPLAIWTMVTMPSASRKSAVFSALLDVLVCWEKRESDRKRKEINRVLAAREVIAKRIEQLAVEKPAFD